MISGCQSPPLLHLYRLYLHHILPFFASWLTGERSAYDYLADSIESFPNAEAMCIRLEAAGYRSAHYTPLLGGITALSTATRP